MKKWFALGAGLLFLPALLLSMQKGVAPELQPSGAWLNTQPLKLQNLKGKVVLINFWVHSCINCHNTIPLLKKMYAEYHSKGLEIIGVHTPEFDSDRDPEALKTYLQEQGIRWPIMQDNQYRTWKAFGNQYWPSFYLLDRRGTIQYTAHGEISPRFPAGEKPLRRAIERLLNE
ncbi:redoxin domain-containing protein [Deinococcus roseus]|uniref:Thioredoxin n=1 Tax=Deinococcus roseus TaxID=392414 RepID=A0ABQ2CUX0_9DEIO|nr:redoxin domain-containing protein [Deinococcus roseus]GGJ23210.1 thioredoxin [Deinococcus roseus]